MNTLNTIGILLIYAAIFYIGYKVFRFFSRVYKNGDAKEKKEMIELFIIFLVVLFGMILRSVK